MLLRRAGCLPGEQTVTAGMPHIQVDDGLVSGFLES